MTKLLENTFRHINIALVNELSMFADCLNVNIWEAIDAAATKPFGFMKFTPGPGVGGHCLPIDPTYLSWAMKEASGNSFQFVELANAVNKQMPRHVVGRVEKLLSRDNKNVKNARILILGYSYKRNVGDIRETPARAICELLGSLGAEVHIFDNFVAEQAQLGWKRVVLTEDEVADADVVVLVTDHDDVNYDWISDKAKLVLDTRRRMTPRPNIEYL
jgi:UDP-N-acetyl-D-glucosamine dehydrogenase